MAKITNAIVRMYRTGTGDCFIVKFLVGEKEQCTMMIDGGTWSGGKDHLEKYVTDLKGFVNNHIDLLVVTHEHKDHVYLWDVCGDLLTNNFKVDKIWMGWTEKESSKKVKQWQKDYGDKKKALAIAANRLQKVVNSPGYETKMKAEYNGMSMLGSHKLYTEVLDNFSALHSAPLSAQGQYVGGLAGMKTIKETVAKKDNVEYFQPGDIIENIPKLDGIKIYVLGPPLSWEEVKVETGGKGESYDHNKELAESDAFAAAILGQGFFAGTALPFDDSDVLTDDQNQTWQSYKNQNNEWRNIDNDWLYSAGSLALRMNSLTNNLSLALAIEFEESGRVMLFPGDAEYGSWASWHTINWSETCRNGKPHFTEDLLSRIVFYKVAHHLSHHGTAERLGMDMMMHPDLAAMATLDYDVISTNWKNTMPNRGLLKDIVRQTKGRLMVMNEKPLFYDIDNTVSLAGKISEEQKKMTAKDKKEFEENYEENVLYLQYTVNGKGKMS
jgi:hypothetical protein